MSFQSRKLSQKSLFTSRASTKWPPWPNFNGSYLENYMEYDLAFLYVFIWATFNHSDEVSSKSEGVTWWGSLVDLTWNDPTILPIGWYKKKTTIELEKLTQRCNTERSYLDTPLGMALGSWWYPATMHRLSWLETGPLLSSSERLSCRNVGATPRNL